MVGNLFLHEQRKTMVLTVDNGRKNVHNNIMNLTNINNQWLIMMSLSTKWWIHFVLTWRSPCFPVLFVGIWYLVLGIRIIIKVRTGHFTRNSHRHWSFIKTNICNLSYALRERNEINFLSFSSFIAQPIRNALNDSESEENV